MNMPMQPGQPGGGMPQPAAPPQPGGAPQPQAPQPGGAPSGLPPELQRHIDPKNPVQALLLKRLDALSDEEQEALLGGIDEGAGAALKKLLPEVGFVIDYMAQQAGGMGDEQGAEQPGGAPQPMAAPTPQQPPQPGGGMARTRLAGV
ncbi:hypothetical protein [Mesorhizobium onobrychidis]|uniref:Magnesium transporter n=1 Tax=Mesorhizobium onobrychidis TaxID=2775404 RepID=A0ABY5QUG5_9HYPH|nr:hypothetical protein [Mesorhizobium onobrychidis]UVC14698.1 hypothetical protein IHQ72_29465 [Mesorhizobium onobrychidis]